MNIVILAAGLGKRMFSSLPKVLQPVGGLPMLAHVIKTAKEVSDGGKIIVVVGHGAELVKQRFGTCGVSFVLQSEQKGTGHAVMQALSELNPEQRTLILYGDVPLMTAKTLRRLTEASKNGTAVLCAELDNPSGYGRIVREEGRVVGIVEEKDASVEQKKIREVNTGFMVVDTPDLIRRIGELKCENNQHEYYLTDLIGMAASEGECVATALVEDPWEAEGANSKEQLEVLERALQLRRARALLKEGVRLADKNRIDIRGSLTCGKDVFIDVGCVFEGDVRLEDGVSVGPYCVIRDSVVGMGTTVKAFSCFEEAKVGGNAQVGPYSRLRPGAELSDEVHIGNFVEIKKTSVGRASKINHLSYVGDAEVGSGVNIGAGTITCNYDGVNKFKTTIEDHCFIGSDTQLIAPVTVHKGATIGAGTTVTADVPENTLVVGRARQREIPGWKRPVKK